MGLHWVDGAIIVCYLAALAGVGVYFSRRQTSLDEFLLAGRSMSWLPVGLSLMAALNSGLDYLQQPSATIQFGLIMSTGCFSWALLYFWVTRVTLPFYRRLGVTSAYEYLEQRFDVRVRTLAAVIFLLWRLGWMATALYVPCLAVAAATGGRLPLVPMIAILGAVVTFYTMLGGIKAVIWTDVIQFCVMFAGLAVTVAVVLGKVPGGMGEVWTTAGAAGKTSLAGAAPPAAGSAMESILSFFTLPPTLVTFLIAVMVGRTATYTCDQVMVQRFQTTRTLRDARQAFVINGVGDTLWMTGLAVVGLALYAYFSHQALPDALAQEVKALAAKDHVTLAAVGIDDVARYKPDWIFPHFMSLVFPAGIMGLVIAAIFAASLSSLDSAINACTAVVVVDFYGRLSRRRAPASLRVSRAATIAVGFVGVVLASMVGEIGTLIEISNKVIQSFTGPILGIYLLGMFSAWARGGGVLAGGLLGTLASIYTAFFTGVSFLWPCTFGLAATLGVGYGLSLVLPGGPEGDARSLTWRAVMARPNA